MVRKKMFLFLSVLVSTFYQNACVGPKETQTINILDVRSSVEPKLDLASHKPNDVEVLRTVFLGEGYKIRYYQTENDSLNYHEAYVVMNENFDKAAYRRLNDTSLAIRLFNSKTKKEKKFEVFGNGSMSGMRD